MSKGDMAVQACPTLAIRPNEETDEGCRNCVLDERELVTFESEEKRVR